MKVAAVRTLDAAAARAAHVGDVVRLDVAGGHLSLTAVGIDCRIRMTMPVDSDDLAPVYLPAEPLARALALRGQDIPVDLSVTDATVTIRHGEYRLRLPRAKLPGGGFTFDDEPPADWLAPDDIQATFRRIATIVPKDDPLGILVDRRDGVVLVASVFRGRHVHAIRLPSSGAGDGRACISRAAADEIQRIGELAGWGEDSGGSLWFRSDAEPATILRVSRVRDGYPREFDQVLDDTVVMGVDVRLDDLVAACRVVSVVLTKQDEHVGLSAIAKLPGDDRAVVMEVTANGSVRSASAAEKLVGRTTIEPVPWTGILNLKDLIASLAAADGESVQLGLGRKSVLLRDGRFRALLALMVA